MPNAAGLGVSDYNQQFLDALEFVDDVILNRQHMQMNLWMSMIERAAYTLGEGLVKKNYRFHAGLGDQSGLDRWDPIQISRVAAGNDAGYDACAYNPYLVDYGFESVSYTGLQTSRRTKHICIKDIRFTWQFEQQLGLIMNFLGDVTNSVWSNYAREQYIKFAVDNSNGYVHTAGAPNSLNFSYDPFATDADGDNTITFARANEVSTLNWTFLRWWQRFLAMQAPMSAIANMNGQPQFGLVIDAEDLDRMIELDDNLREDFRYAKPDLLVENLGQVTHYKGFAITHDIAQPRFTVKSDDGTNLTLKRVDPLKDTTAVTIGNKVEVNPDYLNAEYAMAIVFINRVFRIEVPPAGPVSPGGGTTFGATPSLNGEFEWLNIQDQETNLLKENGFYFGRYEAFAKPLEYDQEAIVFLYRRCPQVEVTDCDVGGTDATESPQTATSATAVTGLARLVTVVMPSIINREAGQTVTVAADGVDYSGIIAASSAAPTYVFVFQSDAAAAAVVAATTNVVSW